MKSTTLVILLLVAPTALLPQISQPAPQQGTAPPVEIVSCLYGQLGKLLIHNENNGDWELVGKIAGLKSHMRDEVRVRGVPERPPNSSESAGILRVESWEVVLHQKGVHPVLGEPATWRGYVNREYGIHLRYPPSFDEHDSLSLFPNPPKANFAGQEDSAAVLVARWEIPREVYPGSNFSGGDYAVLVNPNVLSRGTCEQFAKFWPEHTSATTIVGSRYTRTLDGGAAMGTDYVGHTYHTFQNGLCYELIFDFAQANSTATGTLCTMQQVREQNEDELIEKMLAQVGFLKPELKNGRNRLHKTGGPPTVLSFEHAPLSVDEHGIATLAVSWKTGYADYVQLRYKCANSLFVSAINAPYGYGVTCDDAHDFNSLPEGSFRLLMDNFNPATVRVTLTLEPFRDGIAYPDRTKAFSVEVPSQDQTPKKEEH